MTEPPVTSKRRSLYLLLALILVVATLSPLVTPTYAIAGSHADGLSADVNRALPAWWGAVSSPAARSATAEAYRALPAWWPRGGAVAARRVRPLTNGTAHHFLITVPVTATAGDPFTTTIHAKDIIGGPAYVTTTVSLMTTNGGTISPTAAGLVSGTWSGPVSLTAMGIERTVRAVSDTITGQATITIYAAKLTTITVTPNPATVQVGTTQAFTATGTDRHGNPVSVLPNWSTNGGLIEPGPSESSVFTAQTTPASGRLVTATQGNVDGTAVVNILHGPVNTFHISPSQITTQTAGDDFLLDIEAWDGYGNLATSYNGTATLDDTTGKIAPQLVSFSGGVWGGVVSITEAAEGVIISVTHDLATGQSNSFDVVPGALADIAIRDAADGEGVEIGAVDMTIYQTRTVWAAGYDAYDNYREDVSVVWGLTGDLAQGDIEPSSGISATFTPAPALSGTGKIVAAYLPGSFSDTTDFFTIRAPKLVIEKTGPTGEVSAGEENVEYTIVFTNVGNADAQNVRITETYDSNVSYAVAVPSPDPGSQNSVWTWPVVGKNDPPQTIKVYVDVADSLPPDTVLTNVVEIGGSRLETTSFLLTTVVTSTPVLGVSLSDLGNDPVNAGDPFNLQVTYFNTGNAPVRNIVLTLTLDSHVTFERAGITPVVTPTKDTGNIGRWELGNLHGNRQQSFLVWVRVDDFVPDQYSLLSQAVIDSDQTDPTSTTEDTLVNAPVLALTKNAAPSPAVAFSPLVYTLVYSNIGHAATSALNVTDALPANTSFVDCQGLPCSHSDGVITWIQEGGLGAGAHHTVVAVVDVHRNLDTGTMLTNRARVRVVDTPTYSASAQITTTVVSSPSLWLSISDGKTSAEAGETLVYTLDYNNTGNGRAYDTTITASLSPSQYVRILGCQSPGSCEVRRDEVVFDVGTVPGGTSGSAVMTVVVRDPLPAGADSILASAVIDTITPGDPPEGNSAQDIDDIATRPDVQLDVDYHAHTPFPGKRITYTVHYSNTGHIATTGVVITASQPNYTTFDPLASSGWQSVGDGRYTYPVGALDYDQGGSLLFAVTLPPGTFTTAMPNFDAAFGIYDDGGSGDDSNPANNINLAPLGVPDIVVEGVEVNWALMFSGQEGQHVTVTLKNQGSGIACNPIPPPGGPIDFCAGYWIDLYFDPDPLPQSYPSDDDFGELFISGGPIQPGQIQKYAFSFSVLDLPVEKQHPVALYVRVDNLKLDPERPFGSVPEYNELNNVYGPISLKPVMILPIILRNH